MPDPVSLIRMMTYGPGASLGRGLVLTSICRLDRQPAALGHGIPCIDGKVEKGAFKLVWIGVGQPQFFPEQRPYLDTLAERAAQ
jgi:hypothetical protein